MSYARWEELCCENKIEPRVRDRVLKIIANSHILPLSPTPNPKTKCQDFGDMPIREVVECRG